MNIETALGPLAAGMTTQGRGIFPLPPVRPGATFKRRAAVLTFTAAVQVLLVLGLTSGPRDKPAPPSPPTLMVAIVPLAEESVEPPTPPAPPQLVTPQIVMAMPPMPQIYEPPPPVAALPSSSALSSSITPVAQAADAAVHDFQAKLLRHLNRHKRYPAGARVKREQGVVFVRFTMDRRGNVMKAVIERTSRFSSLNEEGVALLARAQPLPPPPLELAGNAIELIVPVEFSLR